MQVVLRTYSGKGATELFDVLDAHKSEVKDLMQPIKGFVSYLLARSGDGGYSVTVCKDKAGIDESVQKARDWVAKNAGKIGVAAPSVLVGTVIAHVS